MAGDPMDKLTILAEGAKYDVSCSSSGSSRGNTGGLGSTAACGICHTWTSDGRCVSLLKMLMTNACIYDCAYCINRRSNDHRRVMLTPAEVADLTIGFYRRNYIEGLFLSSGIVRSPDYTMELMIRSVSLLRRQHRFHGYVHLKVIPGADPALVRQAGLLADRISVNIELPNRESLALLAPDKTRNAVITPMRQVNRLIAENASERRQSRRAPRFAPAGQTTQLVVGATADTDLQIVTLSEQLYRRLELKRVYYSAFIPVTSDSRLPALPQSPLRREHRLYQADWLLRYYGFEAHELLDPGAPNLDAALDPKTAWALRHRELFPVEVNRADYEVLLRVPGIGVLSARRIVAARRHCRLRTEDLVRLGVVLKRARHFITANDRHAGGCLDGARLRALLIQGEGKKVVQQMELDLHPPSAPEARGPVSGEL